jgi:hypothetical protein
VSHSEILMIMVVKTNEMAESIFADPDKDDEVELDKTSHAPIVFKMPCCSSPYGNCQHLRSEEKLGW